MREKDVETSRSLFEALLPGSRELGDGHWFFRGQADSRWGLVPSIFRRRCYEQCASLRHVATLDGLYLTADEGKYAEQFENEIDRILVAVLQDCGDPFGDAERVLRDRGAAKGRPEDERLSLAQHLGPPTRMLDWTRSPWVGLFFAVQEIVVNEDEGDFSKSFSIFAMEKTYANESGRMLRSPLTLPSGSRNENFVAQSGAFVRLDEVGRDADGERAWDMTHGHASHSRTTGTLDDQLVKINAPWRIAPEVRRILREWGYYAGRLFPNRAGLALAVRDLLRDS